jgi:hypothetical protein
MKIVRLKEMPTGGRLLTRRRPEPSPNISVIICTLRRAGEQKCQTYFLDFGK